MTSPLLSWLVLLVVLVLVVLAALPVPAQVRVPMLGVAAVGTMLVLGMLTAGLNGPPTPMLPDGWHPAPASSS